MSVKVVGTKNIKELLAPPVITDKPSVEFEEARPQYNIPIESKKALAEARRLVKIGLAQMVFYDYCRAIDPFFYGDDAPYLKLYCDTLQALTEERIYSTNIHDVDDHCDVEWHIAEKVEDIPADAYICHDMIINMPPQHLKTRTLTHYNCWCLGKNPKEHIIAVSYNKDFADELSRYTRDEINEEKRTKENLIFSNIFPQVKLKKDNKSVSLWAVNGSHFSYLSASLESGVTGKGGTKKIVDDPIKDASDAFSEAMNQKTHGWFKNTFASRKDLTVSCPITIINMTRWVKDDLTGRVLGSKDGKYYYHLVFKAYNEETDTMLCERFLSKDLYKRMLNNCETDIDHAVFLANYQQETPELKGSLYESGFKTYTSKDVEMVGNVFKHGVNKCFVDVADKGKDYLCAIAYNEQGGKAYVYDIYYTTDRQELTELPMAEFLQRNCIREASFEQNNGGETYGRNVEKECKKFGWLNTYFKYPWTSGRFKGTKETEIIAFAPDAMRYIYFPADWRVKYPLFAKHLLSYNKDQSGRNKALTDDAPDCVTKIAKTLSEQTKSVKARIV